MTTPYDPKVELYLGNAWVDVSGDVRYREQIQITEGRDNEGGQGQPSIAQFLLDSTGGNYNPDDPTGIYYGTFGRNTLCRISVFNARGGMRLITDPSNSGNANAPDSAGLSITGDIDLRADVYVKNFRPSQSFIPVWKIGSYRLMILPSGFIRVQLYTDAIGTSRTWDSTVALTHAPGRISIRATVDVDNGAAGATANFYTSTTTGTGGAWTALGSAVTSAGTVAIYDSTGLLYAYSGAGSPLDIFSTAVYQGIAGTLRANPRFDSQTSGTTSFADAQGNTWSVNYPQARIDDRDMRFWGEVSEWPKNEDTTGRDRTISIRAAGPLRRLLASSSVLRSPMSRAIAALSTAVAWWPGEDGSQATAVTSGIARQPNFTIFGTDSLTYGVGNDEFPGTASLISVPANSRWTANVASYTSTGEMQFRFLLKVPTGGYLNNTVMWRLWTTGTIARWDLVHYITGNMGMAAYAADGTLISSFGPIIYTMIDKDMWVSMEFTQNGANVDGNLAVVEVGQSSGVVSGFSPAGTLGVVNKIQFNWDLNDFSDTVIGQILLENDVTSLFSLSTQINAYSGESVETRMQRLIVTESGLRHDRNGTLPTTNDNPLGYQTSRTVADLLRECEELDLGIVYDMKEFNGGIAYRSKDSIYGQDPAISLVYTGNDVKDLQSTTDDQRTENDVTVTRIGGGSANVVDTTSAMSTAEPGSGGVGRYAADYQLSLADDDQCSNQAGWRTHMGTVQEARWPVVEVWAERTEVSSAADQSAISAVGIGDRVRVTSVPVRRLLWDIDAIVIGRVETLDQFQWHHRWITIPERSFRVLEWSTDRRWSPGLNSSGAGSTLAAGVNSSATSLSVASSVGLWTTTDVPFDIIVAGEKITVTAVSGASSPQTFTVTRAGNGVSKAQLSGAAVELWDPSYWAV